MVMRGGVLLGLVATTLIVVGCGAALCSCSVRGPEPLRIGINAWPGYEFLYLAQELGYYEDEGVPVEIVEFNSLSDARRSFERGQLDGIGTTCVEVMLVRNNTSRSPKIVQAVDYSDGGDVIVARGDIASVRDLSGKRVGVEMSSLGVFILAEAVEQHQLTLSDMVLIPRDQLSMAEDFSSGTLDALVTYPPVSISAMKEPGVSIIFSTSEIPGVVVDVIAIDAPIIRERKGEVVGLLRAFHRARAYATEQPDRANATMAKREHITTEEFAFALANDIKLIGRKEQKDYLAPDGKLKSIINRTDRVLRQIGQISGPDRRAGAFTDAMLETADGEAVR
jgi:NitT/TauT family transport system substrate-binding protein